jgi:hypothetical protein
MAEAQPDAATARRLAWAELIKRVFAIDVFEIKHKWALLAQKHQADRRAASSLPSVLPCSL